MTSLLVILVHCLDLWLIDLYYSVNCNYQAFICMSLKLFKTPSAIHKVKKETYLFNCQQHFIYWWWTLIRRPKYFVNKGLIWNSEKYIELSSSVIDLLCDLRLHIYSSVSLKNWNSASFPQPVLRGYTTIFLWIEKTWQKGRHRKRERKKGHLFIAP